MRKCLILLLLSAFLSACSPAADSITQPITGQTAEPIASPTAQPIESPTPLTFMAGYKPQANLPFVGVYIAQEKGYFAEENLDVTIEHSPGQGAHLQLLAAGKIQVTTQDASILLQRRSDPGLPLVSFALIGQHSQQAYAALKSSEFKTPKDWEGHTVGYKGAPPPDLYALLKAAGADQTKVEIINVGFDPRLLTEGKVDVYPVYKSNEPYLIQSWGYDIDLWDAEEFGVPGLGLTYVTSDTYLAENPQALAKFLRAALRGIEYASEHLDEAVDIVMKYTGPEADRNHQKFMLETELKDAISPVTDEYGLGWQTFEQWQNLATMLQEYDVLAEVDVQGVFTTQILEMAAQKDGN